MPRSPSPTGSSSSSPSSSSSDTDTPSTRHKSPKKRSGDAAKNSDWTYEPPPGAKLLSCEDITSDDFDWDAVAADPDDEIWLFRVPDSLKDRHLDDLVLNAPASTSKKTTKAGTVARKHISYDVWSVGDDDSNVNSEEMRSLSVLLPRKSKGKMYKAPKLISRRFVISAQPPEPQPAEDAPPTTYQNPPRPSYPPEVLKHKFSPYGASTHQNKNSQLAAAMDVDMDGGEKEDETPPKKKKRMHATGEQESPKKSKKKRDVVA